MRVEITATSYWKVTELIEDYPWLANYGFEFDESTRNYSCPRATIVIDSLDDIFKLMADSGADLVVRNSFIHGVDYCIEIYDDYRE